MDEKEFSALLIDDEPESLSVLTGLLETFCPQVEVVGSFLNPLEGMKAIPEIQPDLLFLDVQMPLLSGLEVLNIIGEDRCSVIFVTAHQEYALAALKLHPADYLLKPIDPDELIKSVNQALAGNPKTPSTPPPESYIRVPHSEGFQLVFIPDIIRVEADNSYSTVVLKTGRSLVISRGIREFVPLLSAHPFVRVHRSHIINLQYLLRYSTLEGGKVTLSNGEEIPVSRRNIKNLKAKLDQWSIPLG